MALRRREQQLHGNRAPNLVSPNVCDRQNTRNFSLMNAIQCAPAASRATVAAALLCAAFAAGMVPAASSCWRVPALRRSRSSLRTVAAKQQPVSAARMCSACARLST